MSKNVFAIGSRTVTGDVGKLMLAGEVKLTGQCKANLFTAKG